ncbi:putative peptide modification system cyclase [Stenotrophomonas terrae]|uniref:putative peptide modification system cyclase n=1 Tax=Stenotrophomonas terrae TaxID=405446 RepID=UPI0032096B55
MTSETDVLSSDRQLKTLVLTDLCDSVALTARIGDAAAAELFRSLDVRVLQLLQRWKGRLIDRSDGMLLIFDVPAHGLGFALDYLDALAEIGNARKLPLQTRVGIHVGDVLFWRNDEAAVAAGAKPLDVEGVAKPTAARLMALARPNQILLSAVAEGLLRASQRELGERGNGLQWKSHGRWYFKGLPTAQEVFEVGVAGRAPMRMPARSNIAWRRLPLWRRPVALVAELMLVVTVGAVAWVLVRAEPAIAFAERDWVVIGGVDNHTGEQLLDGAVEQAFRISLEQSRFVNVLSDLKVRKTLGLMNHDPDEPMNRKMASDVAMRDGARAVLLARVDEVGKRVRFTVDIVDPHQGATLDSISAQGNGIDSLLASIDEVSGKLRARFGESSDSLARDASPLPEVTTSNIEALRAYALAIKALSNRDVELSADLLKKALQIDPEFALAHMGLARIYWSGLDEAPAVAELESALAHRERLPRRDQLYLEAWENELRSPASPLPQWKLLATMYPDYFAGASNASWHLIVDNRFNEALPFAQAAAVPQDPLRSVPLDHIGRIQLANGDAQQALDTFRQAERESGGRPIRYSANALALLGREDEARSLLDRLHAVPGNPSSLYSSLDRMSLALSQGRKSDALVEAARARESSVEYGESHVTHFSLVEQSVRLLADPKGSSERDLQRLFNASLVTAKASGNVRGRQEALFRSMVAVYIAQRSGFKELSAHALATLPRLPELDGQRSLQWMRLLTRATQARLEGRPQETVDLLLPLLDGHEAVQVRAELAAAFSALGRNTEAQRQRDWLASNVGRAYVEINVNQLLQPLNVADAVAAKDQFLAAPAVQSRASP